MLQGGVSCMQRFDKWFAEELEVSNKWAINSQHNDHKLATARHGIQNVKNKIEVGAENGE